MKKYDRDVQRWLEGHAEKAPEKPTELTPVIMDWDRHQWAAAIERCGIDGTQIKHMNKLRAEYVRRFRCEPLAMQILGVQAASQHAYGLADEIFRHEELITYVDLEAESILAGIN